MNFTTPADERERLTQETIDVYGIGDNAGVIRLVQHTSTAIKPTWFTTCWRIWHSE